MGSFADFREVIKGLKHKKLGETTIKRCPKCGSKKIFVESASGTSLGLYGITPAKYVCSNCGYKGPIVLEQTKEDEKETG